MRPRRIFADDTWRDCLRYLHPWTSPIGAVALLGVCVGYLLVRML